MRAIAVVAGSLLVVALASCGREVPERVAAPAASPHSAHGLSVQLPAGWQAATGSLTPRLTDPTEVLAIGTFPLRYRETACGHVPGSALQDMGPGDAFVTLQERGRDTDASWAGFPARPDRFGPELGGPSEASQCVPQARFVDHWFAFSDAGRRFHVLVAFGPSVTPAVREQTWTILDGLRVEAA